MRIRAAAPVLVATLVLGAGSAGGQEPPAGFGPPGLASLGLRGQVVVKQFGYFQETPNDDRLYLGAASVQLEWLRRLGAWGRLELVGEVRKDTDGFVEGVTFQVPETSTRRSILNLKEAVVAARWGPTEIALGKQVFAWGTADAFNPTDNLNPYDYLDILDTEKLAVYAGALRVTAGPSSVTGVIVPWFTPSRLPLRDSRWTPVPAALAATTVAERELPATTAANMQYAARARTTVGGWDLSASYFEGFWPTPVFRAADRAAEDPAGPRLTPVFTRMRVPGFDFSTTYRRLELHGEGAFKLVERNGRDDRFQGIAGLNYTLDDLGFRGFRWVEQIVVTVDYGREFVLATHSGSGIVPSGDLFLLPNDAFRNGVAGRLALKLSEETQLKLSGTLDFDGPLSHFFQVKLAHKFTDAVQMEVGADVIGGPRDSFWGRWRNNDRLFLVLRYLF